MTPELTTSLPRRHFSALAHSLTWFLCSAYFPPPPNSLPPAPSLPIWPGQQRKMGGRKGRKVHPPAGQQGDHTRLVLTCLPVSLFFMTQLKLRFQLTLFLVLRICSVDIYSLFLFISPSFSHDPAEIALETHTVPCATSVRC